ncbi:MAG: dipeptidase [Myxococcales bacterium]|nr:dipeptidase [Myxococcales bacterium]
MITVLIAATTLGHAAPDDAALRRRVSRILAKTPLIDGHNDVPWQVRNRADLDLEALPFGRGTEQLEPPMHTDLPRLRQGKAGGVFWSVWVPTDLSGPEAVRTTLEQIDVVHRMVERWPDDLALARTAADVRRQFKRGRIASLIGIEGGHSIDSSLGALRMMYEAGARYMTLTHWQHTAWADAATQPPVHEGLTDFGRDVVTEMNRLGMLVDLSHVSAQTMRDALEVSASPVIFSHSGAYAINPHPRNVPDDVLDLVGKNGGVVMVDFLPTYVSQEVFEHRAGRDAHRARLQTRHIGSDVAVQTGMATWDADNPVPRSTVAQVADHVDHIRDRIGAAHIGIGSDFDGMGDQPDGLDDVSQTPELLVELLRRGYSDSEVAGIAGDNVLRVMVAAERTAKRLKASTPSKTTPPPDRDL